MKCAPCSKPECITLSGLAALTAFDRPEMNEAGDNEEEEKESRRQPLTRGSFFFLHEPRKGQAEGLNKVTTMYSNLEDGPVPPHGLES